MPSALQLHAARKILTTESASVSSCWFAAVIATDLFKSDPDSDGRSASDQETLEFPDSEAFLHEVELAITDQVSDLVRAKILAGKMILMTDLATGDLPSFIELANLCNSEDPPLPGLFNPANATESALAMLEYGLITTDLSAEQAGNLSQQFCDEIKAYWGAILTSEGAVGPVPPFRSAIMPTVDPLNDANMLDAMLDQTENYADTLQQAVWRYAVDSFDLLGLLLGPDGHPLITVEQIREFMVGFIGDPTVADPTASAD